MIEQVTLYPADGRVTLKLSLDSPEKFSLALRVPRWSKHFDLVVNREAAPGRYPPAVTVSKRENGKPAISSN